MPETEDQGEDDCKGEMREFLRMTELFCILIGLVVT